MSWPLTVQYQVESSNSPFATLGDKGGSKEQTLTVDQLPNITGSFSDFALQDTNQTAPNVNGVFSSYQAGGYQGVGTSSAGTRRDGVSMNFGGNQPHSIINPYIVVNYEVICG